VTSAHPSPPLRAVATGRRPLASRGGVGGRGDRRRPAVQWRDRAGRIAGVRQSSPDPAKSPDNWVHIGVSSGDQSVAVVLARRDAGVALWSR
jgi:hypothetical protein